MFLNSLYYHLKPLIPRWLQIQIRRQIVRRKREKYSHVWPIDERAAKPPEGWKGWPDGKKFALVLTHDVETIKGVERVTRVAELEKKLGFRSSFNFIAEEYPTPHDQIKYLKEEGFEVGLHGLNHNGNLFESRKKFLRQALRINQYLKDWGVTGFRTPIMYHNLEWIHDLNIEYDSSTFDTDPFEPQPDGVGTIFPFWVPAPHTQSSVLSPHNEFDLSEPVTCNSQPLPAEALAQEGAPSNSINTSERKSQDASRKRSLVTSNNS